MNNYRKTRAVDKIIEIINKFINFKTSSEIIKYQNL